MRLDKFLKVSRIIKRRPVAKLVCDNKKIKINGYIKAKVVEVPQGNVGKAEASDLIEILETKKIETNDEDLVREDSLEDL